jgi:hypothetical protein
VTIRLDVPIRVGGLADAGVAHLLLDPPEVSPVAQEHVAYVWRVAWYFRSAESHFYLTPSFFVSRAHASRGCTTRIRVSASATTGLAAVNGAGAISVLNSGAQGQNYNRSRIWRQLTGDGARDVLSDARNVARRAVSRAPSLAAG